MAFQWTNILKINTPQIYCKKNDEVGIKLKVQYTNRSKETRENNFNHSDCPPLKTIDQNFDDLKFPRSLIIFIIFNITHKVFPYTLLQLLANKPNRESVFCCHFHIFCDNKNILKTLHT